MAKCTPPPDGGAAAMAQPAATCNPTQFYCNCEGGGRGEEKKERENKWGGVWNTVKYQKSNGCGDLGF